MNQETLKEDERESELEVEAEELDIPEEPAEEYVDDGCPGDIMPDFWTCEFNQEHELNESCNCEPEPEIEIEIEEEIEETNEDYEP